MSSKRAFFIMLGVIVLLIGLCGGATYLSSQLITAEGDKLYDLKLQSAVATRQAQALDQAKKDIEKYEELEQIAKTVVPQEKDQARTVLELVNLANEAGIEIVSVEFPQSELGRAGSGRGAARNRIVDSNTTQLVALDRPKGVYSMEIRVQADPTIAIRYSQLIDYLQKLENNRRTAQVTNISVSPSEQDRSRVTFSIRLNSFVKP